MELINATLNLSYAAIALLILMYTWTSKLTFSRVSKINWGIMTASFLLMILDGIAGIFIADHPGLYSLIITVSIVSYYLILAVYSRYIVIVIQEKNPLTDAALHIIYSLCALVCMIRIINFIHPIITDMPAKTVLHPIIYWLIQSMGLLIFIIDLLLLFLYRSKLEGMEWFSLTLIPLSVPLYMILRVLFPGLRIRNALLFCLILWNHIFIGRKRDRELWQKEQQLSEYKYILSLERVKPHYIYNVLSSIYYLCDSDPKKAQRAVKNFSNYLRQSLYTMDNTKTVPFRWEMELIQNYLSLEQMRFPDKFKVVYDINNMDFQIPPFTVQILVENAVKHGMSRRTDQEGWIKIRVEQREDGCLIEVADNGSGKDDALLPAAGQTAQSVLQNSDSGQPENEYTGFGLQNIRERLSMLSGGTLTIRKNAEHGITASVFLPGNEAAPLHA